MIVDKIIETAKSQKVNVFFDMDGTLVEYLQDPEKRRYVKGSNFFTNGRPLYSIIEIAKNLQENKNIEVHILSNCPLAEQIEQKTNWVKKYMPFLKEENIHIICFENITFKSQEKDYLKGNFIKDHYGDTRCYLFDDYESVILATNRLFNNEVAFHISALIK